MGSAIFLRCCLLAKRMPTIEDDAVKPNIPSLSARVLTPVHRLRTGLTGTAHVADDAGHRRGRVI